MAYETSAFGSADGSNVNSTVSNHYGPRVIGNAEGVYPAKGVETEAAMNFDGDALDLPVFLPEGSYVVNLVTDFATGAVVTATVGGTDITGAGGTSGGTTDPLVIGPVGGELVITGPTAGSVIVYYRHIA
tara:strand:+ start:6872 stop:7261 length:390 start_codon:yes stop_codon:yes gene_type:complete